MPSTTPSFDQADFVTKLSHLGIGRYGQAVIRPFAFVTVSFGSLLAGLLLVDLMFILANVGAVLAHDAGWVKKVPVWLKITEDLEPPEDFNYLKWLVIAVALCWTSVRNRWLAPILWACVFAMILLDDSLQIHESLGAQISGWLDLPKDMMVYGRDIGELIVFGMMGGFALSVVLFLFTRKDAPTQTMNRRYLLIVLALGFLGVGLDATHAVISQVTGNSFVATLVQQVFGMIEDGGEMLVGSLAVALTLAPRPPVDKRAAQGTL